MTSNPTPDFVSLYAAWVAADKAWVEEIIKAYPGKWPGDVRYTAKGRGEKGTPLWHAHMALDRAHVDFIAAGGNEWLMNRYKERKAS